MARFVNVTCAECSEEFGIEPTSHTALKRSAGTFYCTWGHSNYYPKGPTEAEELRRERDRLKQQTARLEEEVLRQQRWRATAEESAKASERRASAARGQVTKLKKRAANGVCPCCNRTFVDLQRHMATKHSGFLAEEILPEGALVQ